MKCLEHVEKKTDISRPMPIGVSQGFSLRLKFRRLGFVLVEYGDVLVPFPDVSILDLKILSTTLSQVYFSMQALVELEQ